MRNPSIKGEVGFYVSLSAHGRGIMPIALKTLLAEFLVPYINVYLLIDSYREHNSG